MEVSDQLNARPSLLYPLHRINLTGGWVRPTIGMDAVEKPTGSVAN
jgi:hypothetical protein